MDIRLPMYARLSLNVSSYFPEQGKEDYQHISSFLCVKKNLCLNLAKRYFSSVLTQKGASMIRVTKKLYELFPPFVGLVYCKFPNIPY